MEGLKLLGFWVYSMAYLSCVAPEQQPAWGWKWQRPDLMVPAPAPAPPMWLVVGSSWDERQEGWGPAIVRILRGETPRRRLLTPKTGPGLKVESSDYSS